MMPDISYRIVFGSACGTIFLFGGSRCGTMRNLTPLRNKLRFRLGNHTENETDISDNVAKVELDAGESRALISLVVAALVAFIMTSSFT